MRTFVVAGFTITTLAAIAQQAHADDIDLIEKNIRVSMSCAAYAMIRTADFPETLNVFINKKPAKSALELEKAKTGMMWTNRSFYSGDILGAKYLYALYDRTILNGDIISERTKWVKLLNDASEAQREAIHTNCLPIYQNADRYCLTHECVDLY